MMKYLLLFIILFVGCNLEIEYTAEDFDIPEVSGYSDLSSISGTIKDLIEITGEETATWQNPNETYLLKSGTIKDLAILIMYAVNRYAFISPELWLIRISNTDNFTYIAILPGRLILSEAPEAWDVFIKYDYDIAMRRAINF